MMSFVVMFFCIGGLVYIGTRIVDEITYPDRRKNETDAEVSDRIAYRLAYRLVSLMSSSSVAKHGYPLRDKECWYYKFIDELKETRKQHNARKLLDKMDDNLRKRWSRPANYYQISYSINGLLEEPQRNFDYC